MTNDELREAIAQEIFHPRFGTALERADRILSLPRIKAGLEALERDEAWKHKLGHTIPIPHSNQSDGVEGLDK